MRIATVCHALPGRRLSNDDVIGMVLAHNAGRPKEVLASIERRLRTSFAASGTDVRHVLDDGERAIDYAIRAGQLALAAAGMEPGDVDFLLYVGVARGWIEPATSAAVQANLGLVNATGFDLMEACASWLRALQVAHSYIRSGTYRRGMIVNAECGLYRAHANWTIEDASQLDHRLAMFTIGEAATATIVTDDVPGDDFYFRFKTLGQYANLCMIPLENVDDFLRDASSECHVPGKFFAHSRELFEVAVKHLVATFQEDATLRDGRYDIAFGHDATARIAKTVARALGVLPLHFPTHAKYGNTVSASVPLGMSLALEGARLKRGDRVLITVGAAGMTVGFATFTF